MLLHNSGNGDITTYSPEINAENRSFKKGASTVVLLRVQRHFKCMKLTDIPLSNKNVVLKYAHMRIQLHLLCKVTQHTNNTFVIFFALNINCKKHKNVLFTNKILRVANLLRISSTKSRTTLFCSIYDPRPHLKPNSLYITRFHGPFENYPVKGLRLQFHVNHPHMRTYIS